MRWRPRRGGVRRAGRSGCLPLDALEDARGQDDPVPVDRGQGVELHLQRAELGLGQRGRPAPGRRSAGGCAGEVGENASAAARSAAMTSTRGGGLAVPTGVGAPDQDGERLALATDQVEAELDAGDFSSAPAVRLA